MESILQEDKNLKIVYEKKENGGKHTAINMGAELAHGEFFFIVDSDDYLPNDSLEIIHHYTEQIKSDFRYAGVAGLRGNSEKSAWNHFGIGGKETTNNEYLNKEYLDATSFEYRYILYEAMGILIKKYPTIKCYFAGASDQEHLQEYIAIRKKAKNEYPNSVFFVGNVNDVALFLNKVDVFVLPSRFEGFGLSLVEAMSMGIPCIASKIAGPEEVMEYGKRGCLFESGNAKKLADVIDFVIQNYSQEKKMQKKTVNM